MSEAWKDMSAYQKLTDGVLDYIMMSNEKGLEQSKALLSRIYKRDLYKCVYESPPTKVFIYICYYKIDEREIPTTLILLPRKSLRSTLPFLFVRYHDLVIRYLQLGFRYLELIIHYYEYYSVLYYYAVLPVT